jgi:FhaA, N-terminal domain/FHA domain
MAVLADLERLLERIFERSTARLFRAHLQPVQLDRRVERAMERARVASGGRTDVPARYRVRLHPDDLTDVAARSGGYDALAGRLADAALAFARAHGYHLPGRPGVALVADPAVERGVIEVDAVAATPRPAAPPVPDMPVVAPRTPAGAPRTPLDARPAGAEAAPADLRPAGAGAVPADLRSPLTGAASVVAPAPPAAADAPSPHADGPVRAPAPTAAPAPAPPGDPSLATGPAPVPAVGIRGDGTQTLVFRRPAPAPTRAVLRVVGRDGSERTVEVDGSPLTLGRATDNGLVIADPRVSRHHARVQARRGTLVLTDLGSTNGSRVNGVRVDECALGTGDRVLVGDTVLLVEQLPG